MMKTIYQETRSIENRPFPTGKLGGAHSQGLVSTSASAQSKSENLAVAQNMDITTIENDA